MDLQHPMRSLVPSLDWAVLEVLAATESSLSLSQIGRLSSTGSRMGHSAVLDRLVAHGLVIAEPANVGSMYRLNREHLLAPSVLFAFGVRKRLLERLHETSGQLVPPPLHASVFGSFARGEAGHESDIDVLLVAAGDDDISAWDVQLEAFERQVFRWTGNRCRCMAFTAARVGELADNAEPIVANWISDGILLAGDRLIDVLETRVANR